MQVLRFYGVALHHVRARRREDLLHLRGQPVEAVDRRLVAGERGIGLRFDLALRRDSTSGQDPGVAGHVELLPGQFAVRLVDVADLDDLDMSSAVALLDDVDEVAVVVGCHALAERDQHLGEAGFGGGFIFSGMPPTGPMVPMALIVPVMDVLLDLVAARQGDDAVVSAPALGPSMPSVGLEAEQAFERVAEAAASK